MKTWEILFVLFFGLTAGASTAYAIVTYRILVSNQIGTSFSHKNDDNGIRCRMRTIEEYECDVHAMRKELKNKA